MTRHQLEHAIRAACYASGDTELIIFGSQAILGSFPDPPEELQASIEVDIQPKNKPENADLIDGSLGEESLFHETHGFYVHGLLIEPDTLPVGWEERTVTVSDHHGTGGNTGFCLEVHDIAASKLLAYREKDRVFVTTLIKEKLINSQTLLERIQTIPLGADKIQQMRNWIRITTEDVG